MEAKFSSSSSAKRGESINSVGVSGGLRRAISLLKELSCSRDGSASLTQLSCAAGLPKPTVHRLLGILLEERLIERVPDTHNVRLGALVYELGLAAAPAMDVRAICGPSLERLATATGEAAYLNCRSGDDALCLDRREASAGFQAVPMHAGNRRPLGVGSSSLALLACLPPDAAEATIMVNAERYRRYRLTAERVLESAEVARARGFAVTAGRIVPSFSGIAVAIPQPGEGPLALSVIALAERLIPARIDKVVTLLHREAQEVRERLMAESTCPPPASPC